MNVPNENVKKYASNAEVLFHSFGTFKIQLFAGKSSVILSKKDEKNGMNSSIGYVHIIFKFKHKVRETTHRHIFASKNVRNWTK